MITPSLLLAIAPKCPLCWAAYMGALGSMGISVQIPYQPWLLPVMLGLVLVNLNALFLRARTHGRYSAFFICLVGAALIAIGKFVLDSGTLLGLGVLCLIAGSLWSASWRRQKANSVQERSVCMCSRLAQCSTSSTCSNTRKQSAARRPDLTGS